MNARSILILALLVPGLAACEWTPPEPAVVIAGEPVPREELACPDLLPASSEQCVELTRLKMRRVLFDEMLEAAESRQTLTLTPVIQQQIDHFVQRMAPTREQYAQVMRCHALAALRELGDDVEADPVCMVDDRQVAQLAQSLSKRELRELVENDLAAEMAESQSSNVRAELMLRMIQEDLGRSGQSQEEFWQRVYESIDPVFYDAGLYMNAAEVITGDPLGWSE